MKSFLTVFSIIGVCAISVVANPAFAGNKSVEIPYTGAAIDESIDLTYDQMKDVFETRRVPKTCYRQVQVGSHQDCQQVNDVQCFMRTHDVWEGVPPNQVCRHVTEQVCEPIVRTECQTVPDYRDEAYDCSTTETVKVGETLDYTVQATVKLTVAAATVASQSRLQIELSQEQLFVSVTDPTRSVLFVGTPVLSASTSGDKLKTQSYALDLKVVDVAALTFPMTKPIVIADTAPNQVVSFTVGAITYADLTEFTFSLIRLKTGSEQFNKVLYSAKLKAGEFTLTAAAAGLTTVNVNLAALKLLEPVTAGQVLGVGVLMRIPTERLGSDGSVNPESLNGHSTTRSQEGQTTIQ